MNTDTLQKQSPEDARQLSSSARQTMQQLVESLRESITRTDDARAMALFETSAEVLRGMITAFEHFEGQSETAWKQPDPPAVLVAGPHVPEPEKAPAEM